LSNHFAWGVVSANPYAIRALEKATRRRCIPKRIKKNMKKLFSIGIECLPFINEETEIEITLNSSKINTKFYVDHVEVEEMIKSVTIEEAPWLLGCIEEGWEWFAFTFHDQEQLKLTAQEIENMISISDSVTKKAYSRMLLDGSHHWLKYSEGEAEFIIKNCELSVGDNILDVGCGLGRHSMELAKKGFDVVGVDYISELINSAEEKSKKQGLNNVSFIIDDCRTIDLGTEYDVVLCLYDVIGTYVDDYDNRLLLESIYKHLRLGGFALISVMNYELTESKAKYTFSLSEQPNKLLDLDASQTMEKTGNIFDPDYYLLDTNTRVVYRKEQFTTGNKKLPTELIVRDRRFSKNELERMCEEAGLEVVWIKCTGTGKWDEELTSIDDAAKEILALCRKIR